MTIEPTHKGTTLTIVQDFPKKHVDAPPTNNEMISIQQKGKDFKNEDRKKTTLTIVQEFPKKKVDNSSGPAGGELVNISRKSEINVPKESFF